MISIQVVLTGRSYQRAEKVPSQLQLVPGARLDDALAAVNQHLPADDSLPASCLVALGGAHLGTVSRHENRALKDGDELVLIAPVAGG